MKTDKEIKKARILLRGLYGKYTKELHRIISQIDKDLEKLESKGGEQW